MLWLSYLTIVGIIGATQANIICFQTLADLCLKNNEFSSTASSKVCDESCISESADTCGGEKDEDIKRGVTFFKEICQDGSNINKKYKEHKDCTNRAVKSSIADCTLKVHQLGNSNLQKADDAIEILKISCRNNEKMKLCHEENVKEQCGSEASSFYAKLASGGSRPNEQLCEQLNGSSRNSNHLFMMWLFQAAILFSTFKGVFY